MDCATVHVYRRRTLSFARRYRPHDAWRSALGELDDRRPLGAQGPGEQQLELLERVRARGGAAEAASDRRHVVNLGVGAEVDDAGAVHRLADLAVTVVVVD